MALFSIVGRCFLLSGVVLRCFCIDAAIVSLLTAQMKNELPKPPRYYLGFLRFKSGEEMRFPDAFMYPLSDYQMRVVIRDPKSPLDGEIHVKGKITQQPLAEIQYSIAMLDKNEKYRIELFNHPFETDTLFEYDRSIKGNIITSVDGQLLKEYPCEEIMKSPSPYPCIQFIS